MAWRAGGNSKPHTRGAQWVALGAGVVVSTILVAAPVHAEDELVDQSAPAAVSEVAIVAQSAPAPVTTEVVAQSAPAPVTTEVVAQSAPAPVTTEVVAQSAPAPAGAARLAEQVDVPTPADDTTTTSLVVPIGTTDTGTVAQSAPAVPATTTTTTVVVASASALRSDASVTPVANPSEDLPATGQRALLSVGAVTLTLAGLGLLASSRRRRPAV